MSRFITAIWGNTEPYARRAQSLGVSASKQHSGHSRLPGGREIFRLIRGVIAGNEGALGLRTERGLLCCATARGSGLQDAPPAVTPQTLWQVRAFTGLAGGDLKSLFEHSGTCRMFLCCCQRPGLQCPFNQADCQGIPCKLAVGGSMLTGEQRTYNQTATNC